MVHKEEFVASIKSDGKFLKEVKEDGIFHYLLPFGSEYSILLKNLHTRRVGVKVSIDDKDVLGGRMIVLGSNNDVNNKIELERFVENGDLEKGHKFRFIEMTDAIRNHRGEGEDDGIIRIEFKLEKESTYGIAWNTPFYNPWYTGDSGYHPYINNISYSASASAPLIKSNILLENNDKGITVPGSDSDQKFTPIQNIIFEDKSTIIILKLKGTTVTEQKVEKPITSETRIECKTCGRKWIYDFNYCPKCGTRLIK